MKTILIYFKSLKKLNWIFVFFLLFFITENSKAQEVFYHPIQISSGFNEDVIAEDTPIENYTTTSVDDPNPYGGGNYVFFTENVQSNGGFPNNRIINSQVTNDLFFKLGTYNESNILQLIGATSGILEFEQPIRTEKLFLLLTSAEDETNAKIKINFTDNTSQDNIQTTVPDWGQDGNMETAGIFSRRRRGGDNLVGDNFRLYQWEININSGNQDKFIESIELENKNDSWGEDSYLNVFAVSAELTCTEFISITTDKEFMCDENDEIQLTAEGGEPGEIYFQGTDENGMHTNLGESVITVNEPGTYYFRAYDSDENCWGAPFPITVSLSDIEVDAGEDQYLECGETAQIGINPIPAPDNYCVPKGTNPNRYINSFKTTGGIINISNTNSGFSPDGYGDFTDMILITNAGDNISFTSDIEGGTAGFRIWIDWDRDGSFDNAEVWSSSDYESNQSGSFTIPSDASGFYRMRIVSHWLSTSGEVNPCKTDFEYGEFEDYLIQVGNAFDESTTYSWEPIEGLSDPNIPNPIANPEETTIYTLTVTYEGCEFTDEVKVKPKRCHTFINPQLKRKSAN